MAIEKMVKNEKIINSKKNELFLYFSKNFVSFLKKYIDIVISKNNPNKILF